MIKVKICGITNSKDALLATNLGADYIGLNFYKESPRKISVSNAKEIISKLPGFVSSVGLFVDEEIEVLVKTVKKCNIKLIQLHGSESPDYCSKISSLCSVPIIKAFRILDESSLEQISGYTNLVNYFLLDTYNKDLAGGTGETFNWDLAVKVKDLNKPIFLAGGLSPENVTEAIEKVNPYAVDVASGVEHLARRKDYDKMKSFIMQTKKL